jgi:hypothetical protein
MTLSIGPEHADAQLAATIAFADAGAGAAKIRLYSAADGAGDLLAEVVLAKPCATLVGGVLTLHPQDVAGTMVLASGVPRSGRWISGDGLLVAAGTVTDADHGGDFRVIGAGTAVGETSPALYAGGMVLLGAMTFT